MATPVQEDIPLPVERALANNVAAAGDPADGSPLEKRLPPVPSATIVNGSYSDPVLSTTKSKLGDGDAKDYLNGGVPHNTLSPLGQNESIATHQYRHVPDVTSTTKLENGTADGEEEGNIDAADRPPMAGRRSVQFARDDVVLDPPQFQHSRHGSWDASEGKSRGSSFMSRLKALAAQGGLPTPKSPSVPAGIPESGAQSAASSPTTARMGRLPQTLNEEGSDIDADAEETADEGQTDASSKAKKKRRRMRRPKFVSESTPNTPRLGGETDSPVVNRRFPVMRRRATMPDATDIRDVMSEGEGRDQLAVPDSVWTRGSSFLMGRGEDGDEAAESPSGRRYGHLRRISVFGGGGASDGDAMTPRRPIFNSERASTFGIQKWRQVKSTLKLLRQKEDRRFDYFKSAELMAELRAGAPAVLMLASMIQRDEHGNKRIPVLLEQVRLHIRDSSPSPDDDSERHWLFTIDLEYGSGPSRMRWTVKRTIREILNLHWKYKLALSNEKYLHNRPELGTRPKQPRFPLSAFPYLRGVRGLDDSDEEDLASVRGDDTAEGTAGEGTAAEVTDGERRPQNKKKKSRMNILAPRRKTSAIGETGSNLENQAQAALDAIAQRRKYVERQQRMLEKYLQEMVRWLMFRADSNRLCRFLELSALGVRLAAEGGYHGKECYLHIQSSKGLDFRRVLTPAKVIARHTRKWFLVRQSYIACVESPENIDIYDVYLVDAKFKIISKKNKLKQIGTGKANESREIDLTANSLQDNHHTITILTSERKVKLWGRNQHLIRQFEESITEMLKRTPWHQRNRFGSFAPVRTGVHAQWLVDGRDYMWNVSRAIAMAKDVIYIHDWWLSPELYMRRPACISQKWRLDRLLQRKAREGVKIFVIVYRNVEAAIPIDSEYTKYSLLNLHPNIFVQRSPNQFKKNQFFFAHHEKVCIVDHHIAFVGGIDLCFGRWDNPQHPIADDKPTGFEPLEMQDVPKDAEHCQLFPGKDYSNPRVQDFFRLNEPYEEMYDRSKTPRMPWHDISMQVVGQPARDLTRHFVQRWNYVRRGRRPTRPLPFLLPPPDFRKEDVEALGLSGTCEVQILRSASTWSLGIEDTEASIQAAYVKMIEESEHFVYMENQFFITSTETLNARIVNRIGDALVERIIRAHENDEDWRCVVIIPLMPGFQNSVAEQDGTSVRLILQCQFRSICRGETSIFGRLRAAGIEPEDYIQFFSLRQWGKIGANDVITTEQLYIHAKTIIVDDRVALIGSANINERSMLGNRDSECAAIVRDTDLLWSTMAGQPYRVGRFAHTLRLRLMREHLGLPVDDILEEERQADLDREEADFEAEMSQIYGDESDEEPLAESSKQGAGNLDVDSGARPHGRGHSFNYDVDLEEHHNVESSSSSSSSKAKSTDSNVERVISNPQHKQEVEGYGTDRWKSAQQKGLDQGRDSVIVHGREVLIHDISAEGRGTLDKPKVAHELQPSTESIAHDTGENKMPPMPPMNRRTTDQLGLPRANQLPNLPLMDDTDIGGPPLHFDANGNPCAPPAVHPLAADIKMAEFNKDSMRDPLNPNFYDDVWYRVAENNTKIFRRVFRCMPDNEVTNWHEYTDYVSYQIRFRENQEGKGATKSEEPERKSECHPSRQATSGGAGIGAPGPTVVAKTLTEKLTGLVTKDEGNIGEPRVPATDDIISEKNAQGASTPRSHARQDSRLDIEKAAAAQRAMNTPTLASPVTSPTLEGDDLFPPAANGTEAQKTSTNLTPPEPEKKERRTTFTNQEKPSLNLNGAAPAQAAVGSVKRRRRATTRGSRRGFVSTEDLLPKAEAEGLLNMTQGTLVQFPYDWLITEENNGNWLYQVDQVAPLQIYN